MNVIGIIAFGQSPAACVLVDGKLVAFAEEERFTRLKGSDGMFPAKSVAYCLKEAGLQLGDVDRIAFGWDSTKYPWTVAANFGSNFVRHGRRARRAYRRTNDRSSVASAAETLMRYHPALITTSIHEGIRSAGLSGDLPPVEFVPHHLAHAYSAYFCSTFDRAGILTLDGSGEEVCTQLAIGEGESVRVLESIPIPDSLGWFYAGITEYLGFIPYRDEGKLMGLAALGEERSGMNYWLDPLARVLKVEGDSYQVDPIYTKFGGHYFGSRFTDELVQLMTSVDPAAVPIAYGEKTSENGSTRSKYLQDVYVDIAWAAQELLERAAVMLAKRLVRERGVENLCIAGGVGLNCKMNGEILRQSGCKRIFVQPASNDAGTALGAAMYVAQELGDVVRNPLSHCYFGPGYSNDQIRSDLSRLGIEFTASENVCEQAADLLSEGKVVAWFQGRMEFGARALGGRSILASAVLPDIKNRVNTEVKYREDWRPFCPSLVEESADEYLDSPGETSFMIVAYPASEDHRETIPSVVHVDGTVRPQTVSVEDNPRFHELIAQVGKRTEHPVVLNTSFNVRGEPIVCTPLDAVRCFFSNGLDALVIGDFVLRKPGR